MSPLDQRLAETRAARNTARAAHDANVAQVRADLAARGIGGRIAAKAKHDALDLAGEALAVARESKGIIAGAAGALILWTLRDRAFALVQRLLRPASVQELGDSAPGEDVTEEHDA